MFMEVSIGLVVMRGESASQYTEGAREDQTTPALQGGNSIGGTADSGLEQAVPTYYIAVHFP